VQAYLGAGKCAWAISVLRPLFTLHPSHTCAQAQPQQQQQQQRQQAQLLDEDGNDLSEFLLADDTATTVSSGGASGAYRPSPSGTGYPTSSSDGDRDGEAGRSDDQGQRTTLPGWQQAHPPREAPQIIFCSRTHSQLSQFVGELRRTRYADAVSLVAVGSRKALCINDDVLGAGELQQINERCMDLQRTRRAAHGRSKARALESPPREGAAPSSVVGLAAQRPRARRRQLGRSRGGCPFLSTEGGSVGWEAFGDMLLAAPHDVEELATLGRRNGVSEHSAMTPATITTVQLAAYPHLYPHRPDCPVRRVTASTTGPVHHPTEYSYITTTPLLVTCSVQHCSPAPPLPPLLLLLLLLCWQLCPYYGSRRALHAADVVLAPYSAVLSPDARAGLGISLAGAVLVFDEAHNLLDALNGAHAAAVSGAHRAAGGGGRVC
jgi:DEAD_2